jgi:predicted ATPase/class 3 adenylate cyclase
MVTFLLTDIEGSTARWERQPEAMAAALARHDALLRHAVDANGGAMVKTTGDGIHAAFPTANDAVVAAVAMQHDLGATEFGATGPLRVRMGAHTCEAELRDGDYYGSGVNRAARLMSVAHGGQIVVSAVTAGLCDDAFPLVDLGEHRLRDLSRAERVWQVDLDGERFPPLRSLDNIPGNLPVQLTEFIGRDDDVVQVAEALDAHRVVTLTGVGGVGKTRLALQVAAQFADRFRHGTWFCDLAPVATPEGVVGAIADALGIDAGTVDPAEALVTWLRHHQALLVIDNCEHVLDESARIVEELVRGCPDLSVLATSREALNAPGEQILGVRSLGVPADGATAGTMVEAESVRLFLDRARAVRADLPLDDRNAAAIGEICRRLDGIPLAIELAAARVQSLTTLEINEHLDQRFRLLTRGSRGGLGRQQTLETTVDWSYQLLSDAERTVLARSSVFAGGFTLAAAEEVVATERVDRFEVLDLLDSLVRRSMVVADESDGAMRYRLLETIRQFGAERLDADDMIEPVRTAHLNWCRSFIAECSRGLLGSDGITWVRRLDLELDNWRAALVFAIDTRDHDALADLAGSIPAIALYGTRAGNAFASAASDAFAAIGEPDHPVTTALLALIAYEQYLRASYADAVATAQRACLMVGTHPPPAPTLPCDFLFASAFFGQYYDTALTAADEHVRLGLAIGDDYALVLGHGLRALTLGALGRVDETRAAVMAADALLPSVEAPLIEMQIDFMAGCGLMSIGEAPHRWRGRLESAAELATVLGNPFFATSALGFLAAVGDRSTVAGQLRAALMLFRTLAHREVARNQFVFVAQVLLQAGRHRAATVLTGASPDLPTSTLLDPTDANESVLVKELGREQYRELVETGRALTVDEALALAITELDAVIASDEAR